MNYTLSEIATLIHAAPQNWPARSIRHLLIDSRKLASSDEALFFAIRGERHDGHQFIEDLYVRGLRNFVVEQMPQHAEQFADAAFLLVANTTAALQQLAAHHRSRFTYPVVAVTGSNGKTIVKEWLWQILRDQYNIVRSPKSFNSQVGVPLSVWQMSEEHSLAIFEAGISRAGEMERLEKIIQPTIGLLTNIGAAHDENFSDRVQKTNEKLNLLTHCQTIICCKDDLAVWGLLVNNERFQSVHVFSWSRKTKADLQISRVEQQAGETTIQGVYQNRFLKIRIPFSDAASVENAIHCWALALSLGVADEVIEKQMPQLHAVAMRLELKQGVNNCSVINDSYNSDLGSLAVALDFLNQQQQHAKRTLILSDILQSGRDEKQLYREVADLLQSKGINRIIGIGDALNRCRDFFAGMEHAFYATTDDFLNQFHSSDFHNETILLKGARLFGFEAISKVLQQKAHETVLEIDLGAMIHNLNYFRSRINAGTRIMAMVKAFSYGSGSFEVANVLQFHRVDYLAVAYADEGIELRRAGISLPIMVMNPEEQSFESMIRFGLEPEIYSFRVLQQFDEALRRYKQQHPDLQPVAVHVKLDTGMRRLGFEEKELNELIVRLKNNKLIRVCAVFSHLAATDEEEHDAYTRQQIKQFLSMSDLLRSHFDYRIMRHILNSAGIVRFPDAQLDMVRLGIGLYGIGVSDEEQTHLRQVSTLKTTISQLRTVPAGETIGYSRRGVAHANMRIATVPIGYADGLSRKLSRGQGKMWVNGKAAPIVGNVCMDMCMIDVTAIVCAEGDEVIVFGVDHPIQEIARDMETIPYEVLTNVSGRVKRVYWQE